MQLRAWQGGDAGEPEALANCYRRSLELADKYGIASVAFPAISCGVYGYPPQALSPSTSKYLPDP